MEKIECPLCLGTGELTRAEILDRLGVKDFARVAQLSAEEAFRLLQAKVKNDEQTVWARFEAELTKRTADMGHRHKDELHTLGARTKELEAAARTAEQQKAHEIQHANRRVEDSLREVGELRERSHELESQMSKVARVGRREEMDFAEEAGTWPGICVSEKLPKNGDYILMYRDPSGTPLEPRMLVDNKDKASTTEGDIDKLVRDARERSILVAVLVTRDESQLRHIDKEERWACKDGIWVLRTTRVWLPRDLEVLKPLFERMRTEGADFLQKNVALAEEVRRTFADIDRIESELKKAAKAITSASSLVTKYRGRLQEVWDNAAARKMPPVSERSVAELGLRSRSAVD
jgi:ribosomal protein S13